MYRLLLDAIFSYSHIITSSVFISRHEPLSTHSRVTPADIGYGRIWIVRLIVYVVPRSMMILREVLCTRSGRHKYYC